MSCQNSDGLNSYESPGTAHKQLTFSEFLGPSYDTEISNKFVDYLRLCFRRSLSCGLSVFTDIHLSKAKEDRQLYTLKPTMAMETLPTPNQPTAPVPAPMPAPHVTGPDRTKRNSTQARMRTGPMTPALKARIMEHIANRESRTNETQASGTQLATTSSTGAKSIAPIEPAHPAQSIPIEPTYPHPSQVTPIEPMHPNQFALVEPAHPSQFLTDGPEDDFSDALSYTSTIPDVFEVGMDNSEPLATGPWMIIDHFTGEMTVDDQDSTSGMVIDDEEMVIIDHEVPSIPPTAPCVSSNAVIQVKNLMGIDILVQTPPPTLLFVDQDVRPNWLIRSTNDFLRHVPYYLCLDKVVDLFFRQEARLNFQTKVGAFCFLLCL